MGWRIVERKIGRAGGVKQREGRQREWDRKYGTDVWAIGYMLGDVFVRQEEALESVYYKSYEQHFAEHPTDLATLIGLARVLRNPHAEATTGVDLQVPAISDFLKRHGLTLQGREVVDIGTWNGASSHPISVHLSPLTIRCSADPERSLEAFWQERKVLAVWDE